MIPHWLEDLAADVQTLVWMGSGHWVREGTILSGFAALGTVGVIALLFAARRR